MAKIILTQPTSGYNLAAINANFAAIQAEFQDKVLYRDNPVGESNSLETDVDVNGKALLNVSNLYTSEVTLDGVAIGQSLSQSVADATTQKVLATVQASNAASSAAASLTSANNSAGSAATAGTDAAASANAQIAPSLAAAAASAAAALAIYGNTATMQAALASSQANANTASAQNTASGISASASAASAAASATARDLSIAAWAASTAPTETLAAMSQSLHVGTVVKSIIYDTGRDSDGGAWRKRCTNKSWFTETLGGNRSVGQRASVAAAWTAAGSTTGAIYQSTADGKFYAPTSSTTQTEVFRGITREFPALAGIVAEIARVVIYDLSTGAMWMVFVGNSTAINTGSSIPASNSSCLTALNGSVIVGNNDTGTWYSGLWIQSFLADTTTRIASSSASALARKPSGLSLRNVQETYSVIDVLKVLVHQTVNDVAVTVLDNAPIDPATGMPVPTVAVATAGGVSVIKQDGTVVNSGNTSARNFASIGKDGTLFYGSGVSSAVCYARNIGTLTANFPILFYNETFTPPIPLPTGLSGLAVSGVASAAIGKSLGFNTLRENPSAPTKGMVAAITNAYNSGWQVGDSRLATLADTVAETITAPELVVNGTFDTDSVWIYSGGAAPFNAAIGGGVLSFSGSTSFVNVSNTFAPAIGRTYLVTYTVTSRSAGLFRISLGGTIGANRSSAGTYSEFLTAVATSSLVAQDTSGTFVGSIDNISVKLAEPDRSVKANGLSIVGSLVKTAVATGAQLVSYSGFNGSNYLQQDYSSNLDYGTGDFHYMWWEVVGAATDQKMRFARGAIQALAASSFGVVVPGSYTYVFQLGGADYNTGIAQAAGLHLCAFVRVAGIVYFYLDGVLRDSRSAAASVTATTAVLRVGTDCGVTPVWAGPTMALFRTAPTAPSADQIAQIYRDELALFAPGAQCTLAGTSTAITCMDWDDSTEILHPCTAWHRSGFKGLLRIDSEVSTVGPITSISARGGVILLSGTSARIYQPALLLRDELARKEDARRALGKVPVFIDFTATASQTAFVLAKGYTIKGLYRNGVLMRETTTGVFWTRSNDGYQETATLSVGATVGDWVSLMCIRSN